MSEEDEISSKRAKGPLDVSRRALLIGAGSTAARRGARFEERLGGRTAGHGPGEMSPLAQGANIHIDWAAPNFGVQEWSGI